MLSLLILCQGSGSHVYALHVMRVPKYFKPLRSATTFCNEKSFAYELTVGGAAMRFAFLNALTRTIIYSLDTILTSFAQRLVGKKRAETDDRRRWFMLYELLYYITCTYNRYYDSRLLFRRDGTALNSPAA